MVDEKWLDKLKERSQKERSRLDSGSISSDSLGITFLEEGKHKGIMSVDCNNVLYRQVTIHRNNGKYAVCKGDDCELCKLEKDLNFDWKRKKQNLIMFLFYLEETNAKSKYFKPENFYLVVGRGKRSPRAFHDLINKYSQEHRDKFIASMDPDVKGHQVSIEKVKGQNGKVVFDLGFDESEIPDEIKEEIKKIDVYDTYIPKYNSDKDNNNYMQIKDEFEKELKEEYVEPGEGKNGNELSDNNEKKEDKKSDESGENNDFEKEEDNEESNEEEDENSEEFKPKCYGNVKKGDKTCIDCDWLINCAKESNS